jgi:fatty-acyl-CoA synthase
MAPEVDVDARDLLQIIYTSGTESLPEGDAHPRGRDLEYVSCNIEGEITETDAILHALPLYHCAQLDVFLGPGVYVGATNVITGKPTPDNILALLARYGINSFAPPSIWIALLRSPQFDGTDLTNLEKGYYGAAIMPVAVLREIAERLPGSGCGISMARPRSRRWPPCSSRMTSCARPARPAARCSTSRLASSTTT